MKIERLLNVLYILLNREKITINELASKLEVSRRTIFRDLETLNVAGIPIVSYPGFGGGVGIMEGFKIDKSLFVDEDFTTILAGLNSLKSLGDDRKIDYIIQRIIPPDKQERITDSDIIIDLSSWFAKSDTYGIVLDFRKAIAALKYIELEYHSHSRYSKRKVEPYKLVFKYDDWYLYAYCTERQDFRLFKLNRISAYAILEKEFIPKQLETAAFNFNMPIQHKEPENNNDLVKVIFQYDFRDKEFLIDKLGAQHFIDDEDKGKIEFTTGDLAWAADLVMSLQDKIKVVKPESLKNEIVLRIDKMKKLYE